MSLALTQSIGDNVTHRVKLRWNNRPFVPGGGWFLIFTAKATPDTQADASAAFQKTSDLGITVAGSTASVVVIPSNTAGSTSPVVAALAPATYYWDIQAQSIASPDDVRTVASGTLVLARDVTRGTETAVPVYVATPGVTYDTQILTYT